MIYTVKPGDTLESIAEKMKLLPGEVLNSNQAAANGIVPGQALLIPVRNGERIPGEDLQISGYAEPFIEPYMLETAYPALNQLLIFSYGFTFDGTLVPPRQNEQWMIRGAWENGIEPLLVLTPFSEGAFQEQLVRTVAGQKEIRRRIAAMLLHVIEEKGYTGASIDFGNIAEEYIGGYAEFTGELKETLNQKGFKVSAACTFGHISGKLNGGYRMLGENADQIILMPRRQGGSYGPPMAVSPLYEMRRMLTEILEYIPGKKVLLGIPNYGYDWALPYEKGISKAEKIGNTDAVRLAVRNGSPIQFSERSESPYFTYQRGHILHEVWFEDVRSIEAKLKLAQEMEILGVGYWNLMRPFQENWEFLACRERTDRREKSHFDESGRT